MALGDMTLAGQELTPEQQTALRAMLKEAWVRGIAEQKAKIVALIKRRAEHIGYGETWGWYELKNIIEAIEDGEHEK